MNGEFILNIDSIRKSFVRNTKNLQGKDEHEKFALLEDIDLSLTKGKITALIGGNGTGKTTLFNIISGFIKADAGTILYNTKTNDINISQLPPFRIARLGIGRMFQDNHIFPNMTVMENMLVADGSFTGENPVDMFFMAKKCHRIENERMQKAEFIFTDLFGNDNTFLHMKNQLAQNLSYGQQRLLGLARLLMGEYKLLLLDEPTSGVNPNVIAKIKEIMQRFVEQNGMTIFLIEHNMKFVLDVADFCHFMNKGYIAIGGTPEDIIGNPDVRKTYLGM